MNSHLLKEVKTTQETLTILGVIKMVCPEMVVQYPKLMRRPEIFKYRLKHPEA